jgi:hypothetical protein
MLDMNIFIYGLCHGVTSISEYTVPNFETINK